MSLGLIIVQSQVLQSSLGVTGLGQGRQALFVLVGAGCSAKGEAPQRHPYGIVTYSGLSGRKEEPLPPSSRTASR